MKDKNEIIAKSRLTTVFRKLIDGREVAVKAYSFSDMQRIKSYDFTEMRYVTGREFLLRELAAYQALSADPTHTNFIPCFFGKQETPETISLILELAKAPLAKFNDDRMDYLLSEEEIGLIDISRRKKVYRQMLQALDFVHKHRIAHLDVKLENYLIYSDRLKLGDFNSALFYIDSKLHSAPYGTFMYAAPETLTSLETGYDPLKADIWAFGICAFIVSERRLPFAINKDPLLSKLEYENDIQTQKIELSEAQGDEASFIMEALEKEPALRPTASVLLKHYFLTSEMRHLS